MTAPGDRAAVRRRMALLLLAALALFAIHRTLAILAVSPLEKLVRGHSDADLLAAGGDLPLELVILHEQSLMLALRTAGLWLIAGRAVVFLASFVLHSSAFSLAVAAHGRAPGARRLHLGWALVSTAGITLTSFALLLPFGWAGARLGRWLEGTNVTGAPSYAAAAGLALALAWLLCEVWFDLYRLALAGARLGPVAGAKLATQVWRKCLGRLLLGRLGLWLFAAVALGAGVLLLPGVTRASSGERALAMLAIDLTLLGSLCARAAWLTWASAHLAYPEAVGLKPASSEAAPPAAAPAVPDDPSPSPDA